MCTYTHLVYSTWYDSHYELQWKRVRFRERMGKCVDDAPVFRLSVGAHDALDETAAALFGSAAPLLRVWQSSDDALIVAFAAESARLETSSHVSIAPSPAFASRCNARVVSSLRFQLATSSRSLERWQLLQLTRGEPSDRVYHVVLNQSTSVLILAFAIVTTQGERSASASYVHRVVESTSVRRAHPSLAGLKTTSLTLFLLTSSAVVQSVRVPSRVGARDVPQR